MPRPRHPIVTPARAIAVLAVATLVLAFVPLPYPPTAKDRQDAVAEALAGLFEGRAVDTSNGSDTLSERDLLIQKTGRIYFVNEARVPDSLFTDVGLKPLPKGYKLDLDHGDGIVECTFKDDDGSQTWHMRFSYGFGSLGGIGYIVKVKKSVLGRRITFVFDWIA